jgi:hypothetical protein
LALNSGAWFLLFVILDRLSLQAIHFDKWSEIPRPPLQMLDFRARPIHPRSNPPDAGTKHLSARWHPRGRLHGHVRRRLDDVHRAQGSAIAGGAIGRIAQFYAVEQGARGSLQITALRSGRPRPSRTSMRSRSGCTPRLPNISGKSPLAAAIRYALTRMVRMRPYPDHGLLEPNTNTAERAMRSVAICRKTYLSVGLLGRRPCRCHRLNPNRDRQAERRRSTGMIGRHPDPHPRPQEHPRR